MKSSLCDLFGTAGQRRKFSKQVSREAMKHREERVQKKVNTQGVIRKVRKRKSKEGILRRQAEQAGQSNVRGEQVEIALCDSSLEFRQSEQDYWKQGRKSRVNRPEDWKHLEENKR